MTAAHKSESPAATGLNATNQNTQRQFNGKSTATGAQRERSLQALRLRPHTSYELRRLGIYQSAARIKELRDRFGYRITTDPVTLTDSDGYMHARCALYTLVSEPV